MKHRLFVLFGNEQVEIFKGNLIGKFDKIKDDINIYEFQTLEELEAFKKGVDEAIGWDNYEFLDDEDVSFIMENS